MKPQDAELARQGLDAFRQSVSPEYDKLREALAGQLAANTAVVADIVAERANNKANHKMITEVVRMLPAAEQHSVSWNPNAAVQTANAYDARQVQARVVWLGDQNHKPDTNSRQPYFIIGQRPSTQPSNSRIPRTDLLVCPVMDAEEHKHGYHKFGREVRVVSVWSDELEVARGITETAAQREFSTEELRTITDPDTGQLRVASGPGTETMYSRSLDGAMSRPLRSKNVPKTVAEKGLAIGFTTMTFKETEGISDDVLVAFDVPTALNDLATAFDVHEQYDALLSRIQNRGPAAIERIAVQSMTQITPDM